MNTQNFDYEKCKNLILSGILDALEQSKNKIKAFPKHPIGTSAIQGMSLDIFPWHSLIQISFCHDGDIFKEEEIANWKYFDFVSSNTDNYNKSLEIAANYVSSFWELDEDEEFPIDLRFKAHIIFLAGANAVLDKSVSDLLTDYGLDQFKYDEDVFSTGRRFLVCDGDKTIEANYCDIIKAYRATQLIFDELREAKSFE